MGHNHLRSFTTLTLRDSIRIQQIRDAIKDFGESSVGFRRAESHANLYLSLLNQIQSDFAVSKDTASTTVLGLLLNSPHLNTTSSLKDLWTSHTSPSSASLLICLGDKKVPGWLRGTEEKQSLPQAPSHCSGAAAAASTNAWGGQEWL